DKSGSMFYSMAMEVRDNKDKVVYKSEPQDLDAPVPLGGHSLPGFAHVDLGRDMPPGDYTLKVTVTDRPTRGTKVFEKKFEVLRPTFGLIKLSISYERDGQVPASHIGGAGQSFWVNFNAVHVYCASAFSPDPEFE